jgi:hypothetical protein
MTLFFPSRYVDMTRISFVHPYGVPDNECLDYRRREDLMEGSEKMKLIMT